MLVKEVRPEKRFWADGAVDDFGRLVGVVAADVVDLNHDLRSLKFDLSKCFRTSS